MTEIIKSQADDVLSTHELMIRWRIELRRAPCVKNFVIDETGKGIEVNFKDHYHCDLCPNEWCFKKGEWTESCGVEGDRLPPEAAPPLTDDIPGVEGKELDLEAEEPITPKNIDPMFG
jgi:hypothetical protein